MTRYRVKCNPRPPAYPKQLQCTMRQKKLKLSEMKAAEHQYHFRVEASILLYWNFLLHCSYKCLFYLFAEVLDFFKVSAQWAELGIG